MFKLIKSVVKGAITTVAIDWIVKRVTGKSFVDEAVAATQSKPVKKATKKRAPKVKKEAAASE